MSSSLRLILLVCGLVLFAAGLGAIFYSPRGVAPPAFAPLEKNEGRLVAAILPVPKTSVTPTPPPSPSPSPEETASPTPPILPTSPTPTTLPTPRETPRPTPIVLPTPGFSPTPRPTRTPRPTPTPTPRPTPVFTPKPTPVFTPKPTPVFTPKPTPVHTPTPKPTPKHTPIVGVTGHPPLVVVEATPKPPVIFKQTPKVKKTPRPTPTPVVIGELRQDSPEENAENAENSETAPGFWDSVQSFFGYISPSASAQAAPAEGGVVRETIDLSYPTELNAKGSGTIELKLSHSGTPPSGTPAARAAIADPDIELETDRCPPDGPLSTCLADHETRVAISLVGSGFEITSDGAQNAPKKVGAGSNPVWRWSIRPKGDVEGSQNMFLTLNFTWVKGAETLGPDASRPKDFRINVVKSFFEWGTFSIAGLILSLLGPILTLPWFYERGKDLVTYYRQRGLKKDVADEDQNSK